MTNEAIDSKELDEAAEKYTNELDDKYGLWPGMSSLFKKTFKAGAEWQMANAIRKEIEREE